MKTLLILFLTTCSLLSFSQGRRTLLSEKEQAKIDSLKAIDWLSYEYDFLDENFNPKITEQEFQAALSEGKFIAARINTRNDSIGVAVYKQIKDFDAMRIAKLRLTYTWERISWYLLLNSQEAQGLAADLGFKHPYRLKEFMEDESNQSKERLALLADLRLKVAQLEQVEENVDSLDLKELFNRAFRYSPDRLERVSEIRAKK
ncbi:MAG: hypothetical protein WBG46_14255 [Nonlabens sp.]